MKFYIQELTKRLESQLAE